MSSALPRFAKFHFRWIAAAVLAVLVGLVAAVPPLRAQRAPSPKSSRAVLISVVDENGVVVDSARVTLVPADGGTPLHAETDFSGRVEWPNLPAGIYRVTVEKAGFYPVTARTIDLSSVRRVEVTLLHQQEYRERVEVKYTPPAIDPNQTSSTESLSSRDVLNIPYSTNRDYRNILPFIPGVTPGVDGQIHVNGSRSSQIYQRLDGFDISQPVTGLLDLRVSPDALRSIDVIGSRLPADIGKGSGEALSLRSGMGDDHFRFAATDFIPSLQNRKGIHIGSFTPRFNFSGPLRKGKAWFYDAAQGEYDLNVVEELPTGADQSPAWRWNNLVKAQWNVNPIHRLTSSFLVNQFRSPRYGLDALDPLETTTHLAEDAYLASLKDQIYLPGGSLFEVGFAFDSFGSSRRPRGSLPYVLRPEGATGNYFETSNSTAHRFQAIADLSLAGFNWHGRHELRFGADLDRITYQQAFLRGTILIYREDGTLDRQATFAGPAAFVRNNFETAGYALDGWSPSDRLRLDAGLRLDWDTLLRRSLLSPRLAAAYMLTRDGKSKLSAGVGLSYASTDLSLFSLPLQGQRSDLFFAADGQTPLGPPVISAFAATPAALTEPSFLNWSAGFERMLPAETHLDIEYVGKRGFDGLAYQNVGAGPAPGLPSGQFVLGNDRRDTYDALRLTLRYPFHNHDMILVSYTRSRARSNAVLDPSLTSLLFSPQLPGPLPWDSPNRLLSWGWLPFVYKFQLDYALDWRTGYPFDVVDENQRLVGLPGSRRFPDFFSLNLHLEHRFRLFGFQWAIRGGFNNITGRRNPSVVVNNIDSPRFLTFEGVRGRAFTGRIRFLGRK
jgi:hypothetical protein